MEDPQGRASQPPATKRNPATKGEEVETGRLDRRRAESGMSPGCRVRPWPIKSWPGAQGVMRLAGARGRRGPRAGGGGPCFAWMLKATAGDERTVQLERRPIAAGVMAALLIAADGDTRGGSFNR